MSKKFSKKVLFSSLMAFCSGISVNAMQSSTTLDNNNLKISKNDSFTIEGKKGFGNGALIGAFVAGNLTGGLVGHLATQKFSVRPLEEENIKLKSENESLKKEGNPISKEDYDKKCKEVKELCVKITKANTKIKDLEEQLNTPPEDTGDDPAELKKTIAALKNQLKVFTDVWGDTSDNVKMTKMKALYEWMYGNKECRSYNWFIDRGLEYVNGCMPNSIILKENYKTMSKGLVTGTNGSHVNNWIKNEVVPAAKVEKGEWYYNAMNYLKCQLEDLKDSLTDIK